MRIDAIALNAAGTGTVQSSRSIEGGDRHIQQSFEFAGFFIGKGGEQARFDRADRVRTCAVPFFTRIRNVDLLDPAVNRVRLPHDQAISFERHDQGVHRLSRHPATSRQFGTRTPRRSNRGIEHPPLRGGDAGSAKRGVDPGLEVEIESMHDFNERSGVHASIVSVSCFLLSLLISSTAVYHFSLGMRT